eukprot:15441268-Alexandrium_andersonii.AAC.1
MAGLDTRLLRHRKNGWRGPVAGRMQHPHDCLNRVRGQARRAPGARGLGHARPERKPRRPGSS